MTEGRAGGALNVFRVGVMLFAAIDGGACLASALALGASQDAVTDGVEWRACAGACLLLVAIGCAAAGRMRS